MTTNTVDRDAFGAAVAQDICAAERQMDAYLVRMGQLLATLAEGRSATGMPAKVGQKALERYAAAIATGVQSRGELVAFHDSIAKSASVEGINWTTLGGPTETTPQEPVKGSLPALVGEDA